MNKEYKAIGLMSGTSLDGLDIAYCVFKVAEEKWEWRIPLATTINYDESISDRLRVAARMNGLQLALLNTEYGHWIGNRVAEFIKENRIKPDIIASHGHTIFHTPANKMTLQIGCGAAIAAETGITTINDFRSLNVALGGQGAPLVPIGDRLLFGEFDACINIGGFANISMESESKRVAFDICPANIILNSLANRLGHPFDSGGKIASAGNVDKGLFKVLEDLEYYKKTGPKSLGREWVEEIMIPLIDNSGIDNYTLLSTLTHHIASQISSKLPSGNDKKAIFTGGGTHNSYLMSLIKNQSECEIVIPAEYVIDYKEALIFALLGVLRSEGLTNTLSEATGSDYDCSGGATHLPPKKL